MALPERQNPFASAELWTVSSCNHQLNIIYIYITQWNKSIFGRCVHQYHSCRVQVGVHRVAVKNYKQMFFGNPFLSPAFIRPPWNLWTDKAFRFPLVLLRLGSYLLARSDWRWRGRAKRFLQSRHTEDDLGRKDIVEPFLPRRRRDNLLQTDTRRSSDGLPGFLRVSLSTICIPVFHPPVIKWKTWGSRGDFEIDRRNLLSQRLPSNPRPFWKSQGASVRMMPKLDISGASQGPPSAGDSVFLR